MSAKSAKVLVVDDSATIRRVVGNVLFRAGYRIEQACDGAEALLRLKEESFDLALVDFVMPKVNGFELCKKMREDDDLKQIPVVLMSAKADKIRDNFIRQTGAHDAISKPFDPRALLVTVEAVLKKAEFGKKLQKDSIPPLSAESDVFADSLPEQDFLETSVPDAFVEQLVVATIKLKEAVNETAEKSALMQRVRESFGAELPRMYQQAIGRYGQSVLSGEVAAFPLAEVFQLLQIARQSGTLTIAFRKTEIHISLREGLIDGAASIGVSDEFRLGRYVIELGKLNRPSLEAFLSQEKMRKEPRLLGQALVEDRILTPEELRELLIRQTSELIYDVLRWQRGSFTFAREQAGSARLGLPVASIVMEGFRRVDEWRHMESVVGNFEDIMLQNAIAIEAIGSTRLTKEERAVLHAVNGERTIDEIVKHLNMNSFDVCKILFQLVQSRLIRRSKTEDALH